MSLNCDAVNRVKNDISIALNNEKQELKMQVDRTFPVTPELSKIFDKVTDSLGKNEIVNQSELTKELKNF